MPSYPVLIQTAGDLVQVAADFSVLGCEFPNGKKNCITEAAEAATAAVDATSQTYVDALKNAGKFDAEAQEEFAKKALTACLQSISEENGFERGSNENGNRMIRRRIPKWPDFTEITEADTLEVQQ